MLPPAVLRISGAVGDHANAINGDFSLNTDSPDVRYIKFGNAAVEMRFDANKLLYQIFVKGDPDPVARLPCLSMASIGRDSQSSFKFYKWSSRLGAYDSEASFIRSLSITLSVVDEKGGFPITMPPPPPPAPVSPNHPSDGFAFIGGTGVNGSKLNGFWSRMEHDINGCPAYTHANASENKPPKIMKYSEDNRLWLVNESGQSGNYNDFLAIAVLQADASVPLDKVNRPWKILDRTGIIFEPDRAIRMLVGAECLKLKQEEENKKRNLQESMDNHRVTFSVSGATGECATALNGVYVPEEEQDVYYKDNKREGSDVVMVAFVASMMHWEWRAKSHSPNVIAILPSLTMSVKAQRSGEYVPSPMSVHRLPSDQLTVFNKGMYKSQSPQLLINHGINVYSGASTTKGEVGESVLTCICCPCIAVAYVVDSCKQGCPGLCCILDVLECLWTCFDE